MSNAVSPMNQNTLQTIQSVQYGTPAPIDDSDPFSAGLTPDALMAYCQSRLDSINDQVQSSFDMQQKQAADVKRIGAVAEDLKTASTAEVKGGEACEKLENELGSAISDLRNSDPGCTALPAMIQTYNNMVWSGTGGQTGPQFIDAAQYPPNYAVGGQGDEDLGTAELQMYSQNLSDAAANINSNSELQMIQLSSLMSQRQTAITLTTNLVQSLGDQQNKIADNIGH
jgi:hypothetical protein